MKAVEQALDYGVKVFGVTVHFVDEGMDTGPIILQRAVDLPDATDPEEVRDALRPLEHDLLTEAVAQIARGAVRLDPVHPRRVARLDPGIVRAPMEAMVQPGEVRVQRALLSVSDKTGIVDFARGLAGLGRRADLHRRHGRRAARGGLEVRAIEDFTGFPEIMGGRVKTLHPKLYAGLLALRDDEEHMAAAAEHEVEFVDLVCVNLYPFEATARRRGATEHEVIENIDIGGPTMIRAAAKNFAFAAVVVNPASYDAVLQELSGHRRQAVARHAREPRGRGVLLHRPLRQRDQRAGSSRSRTTSRPLLLNAYEKVTDLSYGENPHQRAAYYQQAGARMHVLSMVRQLGGKELSFNNVLDLNAARLLVQEFELPACAIIKHNNPCGVAVGGSILEAYHAAFACDPMSAFGGVICVNRDGRRGVRRGAAEAVLRGPDRPAVHRRGAGAPVRQAEHAHPRGRRAPARRTSPSATSSASWAACWSRTATWASRTARRWRSSPSASPSRPSGARCCSPGRSASTCARTRSCCPTTSRSVGIGAGQMSRVDSVRLAIEKAREAGSSLLGAALASDAYFPFPDGPQLAIDAGISAIIQPGGSVRDHEVVEAADAAGISMVFTHRRHFKH